MAPPIPKSAFEFLDFVNCSPTPYHAVATAAALLEAAGFQKILERNNWASAIRPGGKYYLTRNGSALVSFAVGAKWRPGNPIGMIGTHTDSPCLRVKPVSKKTAAGYMQVGVETYGGGIWHSWFDRDLSLAGRVQVRDGSGNFVQRLVKIERPIIRIPHLAIHLTRQSNFDPNKETEMVPIAGLVAAELNRVDGNAREGEGETRAADAVEDEGGINGADFTPLKAMTERHHPYVVELIAEQAGVEPSDVVDFELLLYDTQKACLGGLHDEFIYSARLDNLNSTFCAVKALISSLANSDSLASDSTIRLVACFDHEEIGSRSAHGADSNLLPAVVRRLSATPAASAASGSDASYHDVEAEVATAFEQSSARSFLVSADMAHAVHPNYEAKYEPRHQPEMNKGVVIKVNVNQKYATNSPGIVLIQEVARLTGVPLQLFVVRNDSLCGSTIGPMLSASMGVRTLDLGNPQLSMHSVRETGGTYDVEHAINLFEGFFTNYGTLESKIFVD